MFIGDNGEGPDLITLSGYTFILNGPPVLVRDPAAIAKFRGNRHFAEVKPTEPELKPIAVHLDPTIRRINGVPVIEVDELAEPTLPKRRGRPPKVKP